MADFSAERALLIFLLLNAAVLGSALFFSRRCWRSAGSRAFLDTMLLGFAIAYLSVAIPGLIRCLSAPSIFITALSLSGLLLLFAFASKPAPRYSQGPDRSTRFTLIFIALFVLAFTLAYAHTQAYLPVLSNDALTYHFPAAAQWLRHGRIDLFQTWFFNPANTYSPLGGSVFIVWLMAPFQSTVLARFVEVPSLLAIGLAIYCICRQLAPLQSRITSALVAAGAVLARPIFLPSMMGKDDLFVAFFFIAAVHALGRRIPGDTGPWPMSQEMAGTDAFRAGIAVGLLLAIKYTALLCLPVLLLAIGNRWRWRQWMTCAICIEIFAGPWYLRNVLQTGDPIFPLAIGRLLPGLFTSARSDAFISWQRSLHIALGGVYGLPLPLALLLGIGWSMNWILSPRATFADPLRRICVIGPPIGIALFFWRSPFPEVRFLLPFFLLAFASLSMALPAGKRGMILAAMLPCCALATLFDITFWRVTLEMVGLALLVCALVLPLLWWAGGRRARLLLLSTLALLALGMTAFISWTAYSRNFADEGAYALEYPPGLCQLWHFVNDNVPGNATVAYTNLYLIYPMEPSAPGREFIYAPTRPGVKTMADLGWLGDRLSGEKLVRASTAATFADADRSVWLKNLRRSGAEYLIIGRAAGNNPPEENFAATMPGFVRVFASDSGEVWKLPRSNPLP